MGKNKIPCGGFVLGDSLTLNQDSELDVNIDSLDVQKKLYSLELYTPIVENLVITSDEGEYTLPTPIELIAGRQYWADIRINYEDYQEKSPVHYQGISKAYAKNEGVYVYFCDKDIYLDGTTITSDTSGTATITIAQVRSYNVPIDAPILYLQGEDCGTVGITSHAEGDSTCAANIGAHAEGSATEALGPSSHAEGISTIAKGQASHAEGSDTLARNLCTHAEGKDTIAKGEASHSEGYSTIASSDYQHVQGKYNIEDADNKYAHIVGNGTNTNARSNAHTLDWSGNAWYAGNIEGTAMIVKSSTSGSSKRFKITVDDSGVITATEV